VMSEPTSRFAAMLSSHPPIGVRVARLREMAFQPVPAAS
jgi:Zn-dependent protease with chaperone function